MKRILVTGGSGFIGSRTLPRLAERGYDVHAVSRSGSRTGADIHWHTADVLDASAMEEVVRSVRPTHLLHMAWVTEHGRYWTDPSNSAWLAASLQLIKAFACSGGQRVVGLGTCAEYDWTQPAPFREDAVLGPTSLYGAAKASLGWMQQQLAQRGGFQQAWCRPFFLYGPGENPARLVSSLVRAMAGGESTACRNPGAVRDFLHVDDMAAAIVTVLDSNYEGAVNIGSGEGVALGSIARILSDLAGLPNPSAFSFDPLDRVVADSSVLGALGFRPQHTLRSSLAEMLERRREFASLEAHAR